jgi:sec-independent protein translocase protein TatA
MPDLGPLEIAIIALVIIVLFGSRKLPDAARSLGRSLRIFKAETRGLREDGQHEPGRSPDAPRSLDGSAMPAEPQRDAREG